MQTVKRLSFTGRGKTPLDAVIDGLALADAALEADNGQLGFWSVEPTRRLPDGAYQAVVRYEWTADTEVIRH